MKTSVKLTLFFLLLVSLGSFLFIPLVSSEESKYQSVMNENFKFSITHGGDSYTETDILPLGVKEFENLGLVGVTENIAVFKSRIRMDVQVNFYTDYGLNDVFENTEFAKPKKESYTWLTTHSRTSWFDDPNWKEDEKTYAIEYYRYGFGTILAKGFDTPFLISSEFVNYEEKYGITDFDENAQIRFYAPEIYPIECKVIGTSLKTLDTYEDYFIGNEKMEQASVRLYDFGQANTEPFAQYISSLGVRTNTPYQTTLQQKIVEPSTNKILPQIGNSFKIALRNNPQITVYKQDIDVNYAELYIDTKGNDAGIVDYGDCGLDVIKRSVGWRVENNNIQHTFEFTFLMYGNVEIDPEIRDEVLQHPEFIKGDVIWDISLFGDKGASILFTQSGIQRVWDGIKGKVTWIIVIAICLAIPIGTIYILAKTGVFQNIQNRKLVESVMKAKNKRDK